MRIPVLAILAFSSALAVGAPVEAEPLILRNVRIAAPGGGDAPLSRIRIEGDRIVSIEPESQAPVDGRTVDAEGAWASPGLWDMHVHALGDPVAATERVLPLLIAHGVTGIRDMGSSPAGIQETRSRLERDQRLPRPRLIASGPLLDGRALPWYGDLPLVLTDVDEVAPAVERLKGQGMDFLKVYSDLAPDVLAEIASEAGRQGLPVAGHVTRAGGLRMAAAIGQASIEHLSVATFMECLPDDPGFYDRWIGSRFQSGYDAFWDLVLDFEARADWALCGDRLRDAAEAGVYFTPTLVMEFLDRERTDPRALDWLAPPAREWCEQTLDQVEAADRERRRRVYEAYGNMLARVRAAGVPVLAGTDAQNFCLAPGSSLLLELERLVEAGLTDEEAIAAATTAPAAFLGRSHELGRVAPGYVADIVLTAANPFDDVRAYREIRLVAAAGRLHDADALAAMRLGALTPQTRD